MAAKFTGEADRWIHHVFDPGHHYQRHYQGPVFHWNRADNPFAGHPAEPPDVPPVAHL